MHTTIIEYEFPWPNEDIGYSLFPKHLENDPLVLFHGTAMTNLEPIMREGFKPSAPLTSVSYAKTSDYSLTHLIRAREKWEHRDGVVIAVRFENLDVPGISNNNCDIHVYKPELQPAIIGYCCVPGDYQHR